MKQRETASIGTVFLGPKVVVSDPCYTRGTWCAGESNETRTLVH